MEMVVLSDLTLVHFCGEDCQEDVGKGREDVGKGREDVGKGG